MENVLIVSSDAVRTGQLEGMFREERYREIQTADSGALARRMCRDREYDYIALDLPLSDESGYELTAELASSAGAGILLAVSAGMEETAEYYTAESGALVLARPVCKPLFSKAVRFLEAARNRIKGVRVENVRLQKKIEEIRKINRAKYILMEYLSMTEQQAHRYLEKQAMDLRITKTMVAENLLSTYDS